MKYDIYMKNPYIIAEIGANHNGDMDLAKQLIDAAVESGADCVKFQSWDVDDLYNREDLTLEQLRDIRKHELSFKQLKELFLYCMEKNITFNCTPFSEEAVDFLIDDCCIPWIKIASMDCNNYKFIEYCAKQGLPILLSVGMATLGEIEKAVNTIKKYHNDIILMYCVSEYPPEEGMIQLERIELLNRIFPSVNVGYSDHSIGIGACVGAVAKGATVIEKHFTIDKDMDGWDHKISANPDDMRELVKACRQMAKYCRPVLNMNPVESKKTIRKMRRNPLTGKREV